MKKLLVILLMIPLSILYAFVLSVFWGWFLVPLGVIDIGPAHAYGLSTMVTMVTYRRDLETKDQSMLEVFLAHAVKVAIFFLIGWVAHQIMIY